VKRICQNLRPQLLDHLGLEAALEWQIKEFSKRTDIRCDATVDVTDDGIDKQLSTAIFRIMQELLTNIMRHSGATMVNVLARSSDGNVILNVADDGKGIGKNELAQSTSFGLMGIRERVRSFGGTIMIESSPDWETSVQIRIPMTKIVS
jgi:signal transduction histidine kinase